MIKNDENPTTIFVIVIIIWESIRRIDDRVQILKAQYIHYDIQ